MPRACIQACHRPRDDASKRVPPFLHLQRRRTSEKIRHVLEVPWLRWLQDDEQQKHVHMTKNNLSTHLKWLLKQGPSLYPSLTPSAHENQNNADARNPARGQPTSAQDQPGIDSRSSRDVDSERIQETFVDDIGDNNAEVKTDTNMARLLFAPQSASKPRLLSSSKKSPAARTLGASNGRVPEKSPTERKTRDPNVVKGTAVKLERGSEVQLKR